MRKKSSAAQKVPAGAEEIVAAAPTFVAFVRASA
jgi:hypothetical protein